MTTQEIDSRNGLERALRALKRTLEKKQVHALAKTRKYHSKATTERKRAKAAAIKRHKKLIQKQTTQLNSLRNHFSRRGEN
jgi:small subunit ribosomal protein S21